MLYEQITDTDKPPDSRTWWNKFKKSLKGRLDTIGLNKIEDAYLSNPTWTCFYKSVLFPKIANDLGLEYNKDKEYLTVDATFYRKSKPETGDWEIPIVLIESENQIDTIDQSATGDELYKLCCLNASLKVIFSWKDDWNDSTQKYYADEGWQYVIDAFANASVLVGYLVMIVVVKRADKFEFNCTVYKENGECEKEIIEIS